MKFELKDHLVLHTFVDASLKIYGIVVYICTSTSSSFVMAKACVAPLKNLTLLRLELMAALVGARLCSFVTSSLNHLHFQRILMWSGSQIALHWIKNYQCLLLIKYSRYTSYYLMLSGNIVPLKVTQQIW